MNKRPLFSICMPAIKHFHLYKAINSVLKQNWEKFELIVLDDCGPDAIVEIIEQFKDPRIRYTKANNNLGAQYPTRAWNRALEMVRGEWTILMGDDDLLASNHLQALAKIIMQHPGTLLYRTRLQIVDHRDRVLLQGEVLPIEETWDLFLHARLTRMRPQSTVEMCARTSALRALGGFVELPLALGSDDMTWLLLAMQAPIISTNDACACWRFHLKSLSGRRMHKNALLGACREALQMQLNIISHQASPHISSAVLAHACECFWKAHMRSIRKRNTFWSDLQMKAWFFGTQILPKQLISQIYRIKFKLACSRQDKKIQHKGVSLP